MRSEHLRHCLIRKPLKASLAMPVLLAMRCCRQPGPRQPLCPTLVTGWKLRSLLPLCFIAFVSCSCPPGPKEPERPSFILGWDHFAYERPKSEAEFVLSKGESTDNGKIGIEVVDILPPVDRCGEYGSYSVFPRVELRFYKPSDRKVLCQQTWIPGSILVGGGADCGNASLGFSNLVISDINTREKWVHLRLRGALANAE